MTPRLEQKRMMPRILIAGAGPTGAVCAYKIRRELQQKVQIDVWEKSRGTGGRMSTSRDPGNPECIADLGAQCISVTPEYAELHKSYHDNLQSAGLVEPQKGGIERFELFDCPRGTLHYVTPQGISSVVKHFLNESDSSVLFDHCLTGLDFHGQGTEAKLRASFSQPSKPDAGFTDSPDAYDAVILTMPTPQVLKLQGLVAEKLGQDSLIKGKLEEVKYFPRYALALFYPPGVTLDIPWRGRFQEADEPIRWIAVDNRKRQKDTACTALVVHTSVPFGIEHLEQDKSEVEGIIREHLDELVPGLPKPSGTKCQRWRFCHVSTPYEGSPGTVVLDKGPAHIVLVAGEGMSHSNFDGCISSAEATCKYLIEHWRATSQLQD